MKVGLIGLGIMGKPMAKNLLKAGYDLTVSNRNKAAADEVVAAGAKAATNAEIGETCDVVLTMVPNSPQVKAVMLGEDGVAAHMKPGTVFIDMSSINPVASKEIAAELAKKNIEMLDAPVSGGEPKAIDGTLSFMVGGKQEVFDQYKDLLGAMGASVVRCGEVGAGNTTKLANQIIVACNIQALSEALTLAKMAGVEPQLVFEAIRGGLAFHRHERQGAHDDRGQRQARFQDRPAHQGPEQRSGLRPQRGYPPAHDRRRAGDLPVAAQQWLRPGRPQLYHQVLQEAHRHRVPVSFDQM